jgi:hypothetical protein
MTVTDVIIVLMVLVLLGLAIWQMKTPLPKDIARGPHDHADPDLLTDYGTCIVCEDHVAPVYFESEAWWFDDHYDNAQGPFDDEMVATQAYKAYLREIGDGT